MRLLVWRLEDLKSGLEVLVFGSPDGAGRVFAHDAGPDRTPGPGDEASANAQAVLFRRGKVYVRLLADPDAPPQAARLLEEAGKIDRAIVQMKDSA